MLDPKAKAEVIRAYASALQWTFALGIISAVVVLCLILPITLPKLQSRAEVVSDSDSEDAIDDCCEDEDSSMSDSDSGYGTEGFARRQSAASSRTVLPIIS
jgi:hypothetical protein